MVIYETVRQPPSLRLQILGTKGEEFMKFCHAFIVGAVLVAGPALGQTPAQTQPVQHQPGVPAAQPAQQMKPQVLPASPSQPAEKVDPEKEKAIRHLMDLNGSSKLADNMTEAMAFQVKTAMSRNLSADRLQKFMDDFNQKLNSRSPANEVASAEVSTYSQHFTMEDLKGMIQFYESPVGQRMAKALPVVMQESQKSAADIERNAALETLRNMTDDYPELKTMLPGEQKPSLAPGAPPQPQSQQPQPPSPKPQTPEQPPNPPKPQP